MPPVYPMHGVQDNSETSFPARS